MASLYRPSHIRFVLLDENGDAKHRTPDGDRITKATPGAIRVKVKAARWRGQYRDASGRVVRVTLVASKEVSRRMLAELEVTARQAERGMVASYEAPHRRALVEHLADWERSLDARGASAKQVGQVVGRARRVILGCGFNLLGDISASRVETWLADFRAEGTAIPKRAPPTPKKKPGYTKRELAAALGVPTTTVRAIVLRHGLETTGKGRAQRFSPAVAETVRDWIRRGRGSTTVAAYLKAVKQFMRWMVRDRRTPTNPLEHLDAGAASDIRHDRRALAEGEMQALIQAAAASDRAFRGLTGPERSMVYAVACSTGFRAAELASLTPESFELDESFACVALRASAAKNGKAAQQPLPRDLVGALRTFLADRPAGSPVWPGTWHESAADMLRIDLAAAGIPYVVEGPDGPLFADMHSLRHSYISSLARSGVHPKLAQELARHSDPRLTMNVYTHVQIRDLAGAVDKLPSLMGPGAGSKVERLRATGTEGANPREMGTARAPRERRSPQLVGLSDEETDVHRSPKPKVAGSTPAGHTFESAALPSVREMSGRRRTSRHRIRSSAQRMESFGKSADRF
jgi:integrase